MVFREAILRGPGALLAFFALGLVPADAAPGDPPGAAPSPPAVVLAGAGELRTQVLDKVPEGGCVILAAPGLQYYGPIAASGRRMRIVQVTPGKTPLSAEQFAGWKENAPVAAQGAAFRDGTISASIGRSDLTVAALPQMAVPPGPCVVVLDPDFFLPLYENEVRGGMIDLSLRLYRTFVDKGASGNPLYVLDPLSRPSFPLQWAYLGVLWKDAWEHPGAFKDGLPLKWDLRREAEFLAEFGQFEAAADRLDEARPSFPKDGSIDYQLARLAFWDREVPPGIRFLGRAVRDDRRFLRGFEEFGAQLVRKERIPAAETVLRAGLLIDGEDPGINAALFGLLLGRAQDRGADDPEGARKDLEDAAALRVPEELRNRARDLLGTPRDARPK